MQRRIKMQTFNCRCSKKASPSIVRVIRSTRMRWAVYVDRMGEMRNVYTCWGDLKGRDHVEDLDVDGRIILK
jgi:hypothetical protein